MTPDEMLAVYQRHRAAEEAHDFPSVMETLTDDCFLEHVSLKLRSDGKADATRAYEEWFGAFPDLGPIPSGIAYGEDVLVGVRRPARHDEGFVARPRADGSSVHDSAREHRSVSRRADGRGADPLRRRDALRPIGTRPHTTA
jgi:hypothetical protein